METEMTRYIDVDAAMALAERGENLFICGRAGTGKSTLLRKIRDSLEDAGRSVVTLAPTGIAAYNVTGMTIHSFFRYPLGVLTEDDAATAAFNAGNFRLPVMKSVDTIIIDEISMVRADLMRAIDLTLRTARKYVYPGSGALPFGGVQMIFVGDIMQLPPVVPDAVREAIVSKFKGEYFFDAMRGRLDGKKFYFIELSKVWRQSDKTLTDVLESIRNGDATDDVLDVLNSRVQPRPEKALTLCATKALAKRINYCELDRLSDYISCAATGILRGHAQPDDFPVDMVVPLERGARVICVVNSNPISHKGPAYFNGDLGAVQSFDSEGVEVELDRGFRIKLSDHTFEKVEYVKAADGTIERKVAGSLSQIPLQLGWAVTIHKCQGLTLDGAHVDLGDADAFAAGQTYVALSRVRSWRGLTLERPLTAADVISDPRAQEFKDVLSPGLSEYLMPSH
jgi:ATP-dependent DNA helicase PIF1